MYKNKKNYIRTCPDCQIAKGYHKYKVFLKPLVVRLTFGDTLHLDYSGPHPDLGSGDQYICTIVDSYSTYCWLFPMSNQTAETAVKCLLKVCSQIGAFKSVITNCAAAFLGGVMTSFCKLFGITKINTTSFSPRSNSRVERLQQTFNECLKATCIEGQP